MLLSIIKTVYNTPYGVNKSIRDYFMKHSWKDSTYDEKVIANYLKEAIDWILNAQKASDCSGGIPAKYTLYGGFGNPYPETSGYIIPSLLASYKYFHNESLKTAAADIADWLVSRQLDNGAMRCNIEHPTKTSNTSKIDDSKVFLFDCGAILKGLTSMWQETQEDRYRYSAMRLADYMISNQENDGLWEKDLFFPYLGTHQTRTMWVLISAGKTFGKSEYIESASKCLNKLKANIKPNGYIIDCHFTQREKADFAFTHSIAYTIEGFFRAGIMLDLEEFRQIAINVGRILQGIAETRQEMFSSHYNPGWKPMSKYQDVASNIQIAMLWLEIAKYTADDSLISTATKFLDLIRTTVIDVETRRKGIRGGIPASFPVYAKNNPYSFTSWGAKFFIDASLLELEAIKRIKA